MLAFGNPGSGKTHLLSALGQELIRGGRRVAFTTCVRLVQDLLLAKKELRLNRAIRKLAYYEALVIDDLGYVQQSREEMEVLFTLLAERYERGSVLISSNLAFSKWEAEPDWTKIHQDLQAHKNLTLQLVWQEERESNPEGYGYSRFCDLYRRWLKKLDLVYDRNTAPARSCSSITPATPFRFTIPAQGMCGRRPYSWRFWAPAATPSPRPLRGRTCVTG